MSLLSEIGKGSYARVVKVRSDSENAIERALKIQKPACAWEWYISKEIQHRLKDSEKVNNLHYFTQIHFVLFLFILCRHYFYFIFRLRYCLIS